MRPWEIFVKEEVFTAAKPTNSGWSKDQPLVRIRLKESAILPTQPL